MGGSDFVLDSGGSQQAAPVSKKKVKLSLSAGVIVSLVVGASVVGREGKAEA